MGNSLITGLDFSPKSVKAVVLKQVNQAFRLICYKEIPIEFYVFSDNFAQDYQEIVKKLKELRKSLPSNSRKVSITIDDALVFSKEIQIDSILEGNERRHALTKAVSQQLACYPNELSIDFALLARDPRNTKSSRASYQVYATKTSYVERCASLLQKAGFKPLLMDTKNRCLVRLWYQARYNFSMSSWLLVDISHGTLRLCISPKGTQPYIHSESLDDLIGDSSGIYSWININWHKKHAL